MIRLQHIERVFMVGDEEVHALSDVSMHAASGEHIAIMGPSGSGKSSLLNILGLLDRPDSGAYELDGTLVSELEKSSRPPSACTKSALSSSFSIWCRA